MKIKIDLPSDGARFQKMVDSLNSTPEQVVLDMFRIFEHLVELNEEGYTFQKVRDGLTENLPIFVPSESGCKIYKFPAKAEE